MWEVGWTGESIQFYSLLLWTETEEIWLKPIGQACGTLNPEPRFLGFHANAPPTNALLILRCNSTTGQTTVSHGPWTLSYLPCLLSSVPSLWLRLSEEESHQKWPPLPSAPQCQFTWKAVENIFIFQNASLFGCLQFTFRFPNQLYHPDHLWQVPGQRPLLVPRPAAQGGGQHTFWGRPPPA